MSDFTLANYRNLVDALRERGYAVRSFADAEPAAQHLILRHDIDVDLDPAVAMAEAEAEMGVAAAYFVMLRNPLYNPFAERERLMRLLALGHEVGLHLDAALYNDVEPAAVRECGMLEEILGAPVSTISFHRPAEVLRDNPAELAGRRHTYQPRVFSRMGYCSDSRGAWRHGHPLEHEAVAVGRALQLLTHPVWWSGAGERVTERLDAIIDARAEAFRHHLEGQIETYRRGE
jgi:hypothetical protein